MIKWTPGKIEKLSAKEVILTVFITLSLSMVVGTAIVAVYDLIQLIVGD